MELYIFCIILFVEGSETNKSGENNGLPFAESAYPPAFPPVSEPFMPRVQSEPRLQNMSPKGSSEVRPSPPIPRVQSESRLQHDDMERKQGNQQNWL